MPGIIAPGPLSKYLRWLLRVSGTSETIRELYEFFSDAPETPTVGWRRCMVRFQRLTPTGTVEDFATTKLDILNVTDGDPDDTWITGDFTTAETALNTFFGVVMGDVPNTHTLLDYRWYAMHFNPDTSVKPFADSGPPVRVTSRNVTGTVTGTYQPYQLAQTVTWLTPHRKHWGRMYLPAPSPALIDNRGRFTSGKCVALANAADTLVGALQAAQLFPVVPITQIDKAPFRALSNITGIQVDDIPDVQRRRRARQANIREKRT